jgi:hypothetical protein
MKNNPKPVYATIFFGLMCALAFIPLNMALNSVVFRPDTFFIIIWFYLAGYSLLLARWRKTRLHRLAVPLLLLAGAAFLVHSLTIFLLISLGMLSWIRSWICFPKSFFRMLVVEPLFCFGSGAVIGIFTPASTPAWAMGIWLFFLIQALYFVFFDDSVQRRAEKILADPFESAMAAAKKILSPDQMP